MSRKVGTATPMYLMKDVHGDTTAVLQNGATVRTYDYDMFGKQVTSSGTAENPYRYCGEYIDGETGFIYLRNRYYDPSIGRFISEDPYWNPANMIYGDNGERGLPDFAAIVQSSNLYVYCRNNPINRDDIWGLYDRDKAVRFAKTYFIEKIFSSNHPYYQGHDCANFVSYCLKAGKVQQDDNWYMNFVIGIAGKYIGSWSASWTVASEQYRIFSDPSFGYSTGKFTVWSASGVKIAAKYQNVRPGDLLYFCDENGQPTHATIITDVTETDIYYNAHSNQRNHQSLAEVIENPVVIIRMNDDA